MIRLLDGRVADITDSEPACVLKILRQVKICHTPIRVSREAVSAATSRRLRYSRVLLAMSGRVAMNRIRLPLALSIAGHAVVLALLILFAAATRTSLETATSGGFEVVLGQPLPEAKPSPAPQTLPSRAAAATQPERPVEAAEPAPAPAPEVPVPPPPLRKPVIREPLKNVTHRPERSRAPVSEPTPTPSKFAQMRPAGVAGAQDSAGVAAASVAAPASVPRPDVTASYQAMISAWLESHKRYPESARERGEEGNAALRFRIDRSGRVLDYSYRSTGYADLDAGLDEMLRGAQLPPFPPSMTASRIEVSLTMQFNLTR
jgi:protein TonB